MQALKCDRCKRLYEMYDNINGMAFVVNEPDRSYRFSNTFDLCPACVRQLKRFMNGEENTEQK